jgi:tetratricopeptide (TPR) repeat protein
MDLEEQFWFNDDRWAGHYLLVTGYDDVRQVFIAQDSFIGANREVPYADLDQNWRAFNRVYLLVYPPEQENLVQELLGGDNNIDINRQNALQVAQREIESEPDDPIAWFNLGSNLVYFERYNEAAEAYDIARSNELPQRMLRYQFGPFLAYFHANRIDDLMTLTEYALTVTPNSEEALLWQGWAYYRLGKKSQALDSFLAALEPHPGYADAEYAINFVQNN